MNPSTAEAGNSKLAILWLAKSCRASRLAPSPSQLVRMGFSGFLAWRRASMASMMPCATDVLDTVAVGQFMMRMASVPGSSRRIFNAAQYLSAPASPITSIGLPRDHVGGSTASSALMVLSDNFASVPCRSIKRSTASTPAPPPFVSMARRSPADVGRRARLSAASKSSFSS